MQYFRILTFFVITSLISGVFYPIVAFADSNKDEHVAMGNGGNSHGNKQSYNSKESEEHGHNKSDLIASIPQTGPDEGDNNHPSGKDRSIEHGNSQIQGKSQSDPDGDKNANGGVSGKDKIGLDGGFDKGDQDGNNGCGNDDDFEDDNNGNCNSRNHNKNPGDCDKNGSTGDKNGRPCDPGKNNASDQGCKHGEPDCNDRNEKPKNKEKEKNRQDNENRTSTSIVININNQVNNHQSSQSNTSQALGVSTLAATGDYMLKLGTAAIAMGISSSFFGLFVLARKAFNKVFHGGFQPYFYLYEA